MPGIAAMIEPFVFVFKSELEMPVIASAVVVAAVPVAFTKVKFWRVDEAVARRLETVTRALKMFGLVNVFVVYVFGIVVDASTKWMAEVVDQASPTDEKYEADVVLKKLRLFFHSSADVVEKKKPLSMPERKAEESVVVPTTLPCAFVERSAFGTLVMARLEVVAFVAVRLVVVALVVVALSAVRLKIVDDACAMRPLVKVRVVDVELFGNG